jgi:hypothetical protein
MRKANKHSAAPTETRELMHAALGFRAHSGWAAMVAVAGSTRLPEVVDRRRIELAARELPRPVQPYHDAQKLSLAEAEEYVKHFADQAKLLAGQALRAVIEDVREMGCEVVSCGLLLGSGRPVGTLKAVLASHPMLHTAEGELFRNALSHASKELRLPVLGVREKEIHARGADELGFRLDDLKTRLTGLGQPIGPPWSQDQKLAALVAWLALALRGRMGT